MISYCIQHMPYAFAEIDVNVFCIALHCTALHRDERLGPMLQWALVRVKKLSAHGKVSV